MRRPPGRTDQVRPWQDLAWWRRGSVHPIVRPGPVPVAVLVREELERLRRAIVREKAAGICAATSSDERGGRERGRV